MPQAQETFNNRHEVASDSEAELFKNHFFLNVLIVVCHGRTQRVSE